jgi:predicted adenine nucleotide alpha hydrolase (AANH) superfamily ATPase
MNDSIETVEVSIQQAKETVDKMTSLLKLSKNKDFKKIVEEGYFEKEASRLVLLKADPSLQSDEDQKQIDNSIIAIGYFRQYLGTVIQLGRMAEKSLKEDESVLQELRNEELGE